MHTLQTHRRRFRSHLGVSTAVMMLLFLSVLTVAMAEPLTFDEALEVGRNLTPPSVIDPQAQVQTPPTQPYSGVSQQVARSGLAGMAMQGRPTGALNFSCTYAACTCSGDADCNDMFSTNVCGEFAVCFEGNGGSVWCICGR